MNTFQAFFHRGWNQWVVGCYDSTRGGSALSYRPMRDEADAEEYARAENAREAKLAAQRKAFDAKTAKAAQRKARK